LPTILPCLATLSHAWKEAAESITFRNLSFKSTELDSLRTIATGRRCQQLAHVRIDVMLPEYTEEACARIELEEEQRMNDEALFSAISELFAILKAWENNGLQNTFQ
jgi:hypothetical protein